MLRVLGADKLPEETQLKLAEFLTTRHQFQASVTQSGVYDHAANGERELATTVMPFEIAQAVGIPSAGISIQWTREGNQLTISIP